MGNNEKRDNTFLKEDANFIKLSEEEQKAVSDLNAVKFYKKGTLLLKEGQMPSKSFFVLEGCIRQYYLLDGEEKTTFFFTENQSIQTVLNTENLETSKFYLECIEDSKITETTFKQEKDMYERFPRFQELCRKSSEKELIEYQNMFAEFMTSSPEQRYLNLLKNRSDLLNRVPQYQLASYLGIKPESLSRIRKRISLKK